MTSAFYGLCYHYIRQDNNDPFPRIFGTKINDFVEHVKMVQKKFDVMSLDDIQRFYEEKTDPLDVKKGVVFTFDDGLSDQFEAAKILNENNISGIFFIPTCSLFDNIPANPVILHYAIAIHGLKEFMDQLETIFEKYNIDKDSLFIRNENVIENKFEIIDKIKDILYYKINHTMTRQILSDIYQEFIVSENISNNDIHLSINQLKKLLEMGHKIGTHSHSHISVASSKMSDEEFNKEIIKPKELLEKKFQMDIISMSYPFGEKRDCLESEKLLKKTNSYEFAFTIENKLNVINTPKLEIGRYMVHSKDNALKLEKRLKKEFGN